MNIVIKNTKTVDEYKQKHDEMQEKALFCYQEHKRAFEKWQEGEPIKVWTDSADNLCIEYASGNWWHYKVQDNKKLEWW